MSKIDMITPIGVYERLISFLANIKLNFKSNVLFFLPIGVGGLLGIALFSYPIEFLLEHYEIPTLWGFSGGVLGTIPSLLNDTKQSTPKNRLKWGWIIGSVLSSTLLILLPSGNAYEGISYANVTGMEIVITALVFVLGILFGLWMVKLEKDYKE